MLKSNWLEAIWFCSSDMSISFLPPLPSGVLSPIWRLGKGNTAVLLQHMWVWLRARLPVHLPVFLFTFHGGGELLLLPDRTMGNVTPVCGFDHRACLAQQETTMLNTGNRLFTLIQDNSHI